MTISSVPATGLEQIDGVGAIGALHLGGWDELIAEAGPRDPLRCAAVLELLADAGVNRGTPRSLVVERDGAVVAAAALTVTRELGLATVRHMGCTSAWLAPDLPAVDSDARAALVDALVSQPGDLLVLDDLVADSPFVNVLRARCPTAQVIEADTTYVAPTGANGKQVLKRRSESRRVLRRAAERGVPLTVWTGSAWDEIEPQVRDLLEFQAACRRGKSMDALTATPDGRAMAARVIATLGRAGHVRVATVRAADELVAFHLAVICRNHAVGFKTAAQREVAGLSGIGWCSMFAMNDALAAEGVETIDLGFGGDDYKRHIASAVQLVKVRVPLSAMGSAYLALLGARRRGLTLARQARNEPGVPAAIIGAAIGI